MIKKYALLQIITAFVLLLSFKLALAAIPPTLNYQGHLTDRSGKPIDGTAKMMFAIYDVDIGGTALWGESLEVAVAQGVFSVELGGKLFPFPLGLFERPLWIGMAVGGDAEMIPRRPISSVGFSFKADDANRLEGVRAATLDQSAHVIDTANPHNVTTAQIGAIAGTDLTAHTSNGSAHHIKTSSFPELSGQIGDVQIPPLIARDAEIMPTVLANDGPGSTLNADLLDGFTAGAFMAVSADNWVNTTGDVMTGALILPIDGLIAGGNQLSLSGGNVGIGTTSPTAKLDIAATGAGAELLRLSTEREWAFRQLGAGQNTHLELVSIGGGGNKNFVINTTGNVGIGTTSPTAKLDIAATGAGAELLRLSTEREWAFRQLGAGQNTHLELASIGGGGSKNFVINTTGNVGIGTTSPTENLEVAGTAKVSGNLTVNGKIAGSARGIPIYTGIPACGSGGAITLQASCSTSLCSPIPIPLFWTCNRDCTALAPPTCPLPIAGYLVAP